MAQVLCQDLKFPVFRVLPLLNRVFVVANPLQGFPSADLAARWEISICRIRVRLRPCHQRSSWIRRHCEIQPTKSAIRLHSPIHAGHFWILDATLPCHAYKLWSKQHTGRPKPEMIDVTLRTRPTWQCSGQAKCSTENSAATVPCSCAEICPSPGRTLSRPTTRLSLGAFLCLQRCVLRPWI